MAFWSWSKTSSANATADATINWAEGQAPSSVNDSSRAMMARTAEYRDDIAGAIVTGGTSIAYTVTSNQVFDTLAHMNGAMIAFTPHATNGGFCSLSVDGLTARNIRSSTGNDIPAGTLIAGTPYAVTYNNSDGMFYLHGFFGNPYSIPLAGGMDYWGTTAPNSSFVFPTGQAISRTTYSALFAILSTSFGTGDGSTTFNLPDKRGRASFCVDNMGGVTANRLAAGSLAPNRHTVGTAGAGGLDTHLLTTAEIPSHTHANTLTDPGHNHSTTADHIIAGSGFSGGAGNTTTGGAVGNNTTGISINNAAQGGGTAHDNLPPLILCNYIMRII